MFFKRAAVGPGGQALPLTHPPTCLGISSGLWDSEGNADIPIQLQKDPPPPLLELAAVGVGKPGLIFANCKDELNPFFLVSECQAGVAPLCPLPFLFVAK